MIILKNSYVVTIKKLRDWEEPRAIALDHSNKILLVSVIFGETKALMKMDIDGQLLGFVKARPEGINTPSQFGTIKDMLTVTSNRYLMTDWNNEKLYLLQLAKNNMYGTVKTVATAVKKPYGLVLSDRKDKLYVGGRGCIEVLDVSGMFKKTFLRFTGLLLLLLLFLYML